MELRKETSDKHIGLKKVFANWIRAYLIQVWFILNPRFGGFFSAS